MTEDDPSFVLYTDAMGALFERHPLRESVAGTVESIAGITPETLYACHRAFYRPSNAALCIVGDVEPERCAEAASRVEWTDGGGCAAPDFGPPEGLEPVKTRTERAMDVSEPLFTVAAKLCTALPQGEEASRLITAGALAARCLFGQSSEFYTSLYAEGLLRGDFYRDVSPLAGTLLFECGGASAEPGRVFERLCAALSAAAGRGLDAAGFERARRADYGVSLRMLNDADALAPPSRAATSAATASTRALSTSAPSPSARPRPSCGNTSGPSGWPSRLSTPRKGPDFPWKRRYQP